MRRHGADWLAWSLQFVAGLVAGAVTGFFANWFARRYGPPWFRMDSLEFGVFLLGCASLGAGLAALLGDRLWLGSAHPTHPEEPRHSRMSLWTARLAAAAGVVIVLTAIVLRFRLA